MDRFVSPLNIERYRRLLQPDLRRHERRLILEELHRQALEWQRSVAASVQRRNAAAAEDGHRARRGVEG